MPAPILVGVLATAVGVFAQSRPRDATAVLWLAGLGLLGYRLVARTGDRDVVRTFAIAFLVRAVAVFVLHYVFFLNDPSLLGGDDTGYDNSGRALLNFWQGEGDPPRIGPPSGIFSYYAINAALLAVAGERSILIPRVVNAFLGALIAVLVHRSATQLFDRRAGRIAGLLAALLPSLIVWSSLNMRDVWAWFGIVVVAHQVIAIERRGFGAALPGLLGGMAILALIRSWVVLIVILGLLSGYLLAALRGRARAVAAVGVVLLFGALVLGLGVGREYIVRISERGLTGFRAGTTVDQSAFAAGVDLSSLGSVLRFLPVGISYMLFGPFPWNVQGMRQALALPEVLFWYFLLTRIVAGAFRGIRARPVSAAPLLAICGGIFIGLALLEGNLGLIYRHRAQAAVVLLIFAGGGWARARARAGSAEAPALPRARPLATAARAAET